MVSFPEDPEVKVILFTVRLKCKVKKGKKHILSTQLGGLSCTMAVIEVVLYNDPSLKHQQNTFGNRAPHTLPRFIKYDPALYN